jgi:hypothetical protein
MLSSRLRSYARRPSVRHAQALDTPLGWYQSLSFCDVLRVTGTVRAQRSTIKSVRMSEPLPTLFRMIERLANAVYTEKHHCAAFARRSPNGVFDRRRDPGLLRRATLKPKGSGRGAPERCSRSVWKSQESLAGSNRSFSPRRDRRAETFRFGQG